jgi:hypothetical protein
MFVLHFIGTDGKSSSAVPASLTDFNGPDARVRHSSTARAHALEAASRAEAAVQVSREIAGGKVKPAYIVMPDGTVKAPVGMKVPEREVCHKDDPAWRGACFCSACRAERRGA